MASDDSFDPKSWGGSAEKRPDKSPALPDAWKVVVDDAEPAGSDEPRRAGRKGLFAGLALVATACAGAGWYLTSRPAETSAIAAAPLPEAAATSATAGAEAANALSSRTLVLTGPQDLLATLKSVGFSDADANAVTKAALGALGAAKGQIKAVVSFIKSADGVSLVRLEASNPDGSGAVVSRNAEGALVANRVAAELSKQIKVVRGELDTNSFYSSAVSAGVIDSLIPEFVNAFAFDFDLQQEVSPGDVFEVAYEQTVNAAGEPLGDPQLLYASLTTPTKARALYRFKPEGQDVGWFDGNGGSTVRSFMRTPVDGARISSKFGFRLHPVLGYMKLHRGTDFAAPTGTPIYASGDASVEWAAFKGANGNLTVLRHDNGWRTLYLHQSMFMPGIAPGVRVMQGQKIGEVGTTGRSTGPHLHYEVHIDGQPVDPLSIKTESGRKGLEGPSLTAFFSQRDRVDVARARQAQ